MCITCLDKRTRKEFFCILGTLKTLLLNPHWWLYVHVQGRSCLIMKNIGGLFDFFSQLLYKTRKESHAMSSSNKTEPQRKLRIFFDKMTVLMRDYQCSLLPRVVTRTIRTKFLLFWEIRSCRKFIFHIRDRGTGNEVLICDWKET